MKFSKVHLQLIKEQNFEYNSRKISSTSDIVKLISEIENIESLSEERMYIITLDNKLKLVSYSEIGRGSSNSVMIDMKVIFKTILLSNCSKFVLIHNHPHGDITPSKHDLKLTKEVLSASEIMDTEFLDHIIIGENNTFCSCMDIVLNGGKQK